MERPDLYNEKCCDHHEIKITVKTTGKIITLDNLEDHFTILKTITYRRTEKIPARCRSI